MKKLLSILASVGLVATASTSVVSCTKKDLLPTYHDVSDIGGNYLNDNQILLDANNKDYILGTIANSFKNPMDLLKNSSELTIKTNGVVSSNDNGETQIISLNVVKQKSNQNDYDIQSSEIKIKVVKNNDQYFDVNNNVELLNIDLKNSDSLVVRTLMNEGNNMLNVNSNNRNDWINIESEGTALMSMDQSLFNQLAEAQKNMLPGFDKQHNNLRYDSVFQQIVASYCSQDKNKDELKIENFKEWKDKMINMNKEILTAMSQYIDAKKGFSQDFITNNVSSILLPGLNPTGKQFFK